MRDIHRIYILNQGSAIFYLLYANDIVLFLHAFSRSARKLASMLSLPILLGSAFPKNQLFFGRCSPRCKVRIKDIIQVGASLLLVKYLGAPLLIGKTSKLHFFSLVGSLSSGVRSVSPNLRVA